MRASVHLNHAATNTGGGTSALRYFTTAAVVVLGYLAFTELPIPVAEHTSSEQLTYYFTPSKGDMTERVWFADQDLPVRNANRIACEATSEREKSDFGAFSYKCTFEMAAAFGRAANDDEAFQDQPDWIIRTFRPLPTEAGSHFNHGFSRELRIFGVGSEDGIVGAFKILFAGLLALSLRGTLRANSTRAQASARSAWSTALLISSPLVAVAIYSATVVAIRQGQPFDPLSERALEAALIKAVLIAPVAEELMFRVWMLTLIEKATGTSRAVFLSSCVFAVAHAPTSVLDALFYFTVGTLFALLWARRRSIPLNIAVHAMVNLFVLSISVLWS